MLASLSLQPHKTPWLLLEQDQHSRSCTASYEPVLSETCQKQVPILTHWPLADSVVHSFSSAFPEFIPRQNHAWQTTKDEMGVATHGRLRQWAHPRHYCGNDKMLWDSLNIFLWFQLQKFIMQITFNNNKKKCCWHQCHVKLVLISAGCPKQNTMLKKQDKKKKEKA